MDFLKKINWLPYGVILLGLTGITVSIYLSLKQITGAEIGTCPIFGTGCGDVLHSKYSKFLGIPLAYFGVLFYFSVITLGSLAAITKKEVWIKLLALFALVGFIDSVGFIYIQGVLIGAYCFYCVISATASTLLFFLMLPTIIDKVLDLAEKSD
jgi:uncharacterized membrane protein